MTANGFHPHQVAPIEPPRANPNYNTAAVHRRKIEQIAQDAESLAGTASLIANRFRQVLDHGGGANVQQQMVFIVGAVARMQKDWGVVEHLQAQGSTIKKPATRKS